MSIKSIIAALAVVGSSSVALAAPSNYRATASYPQTSIHSPNYAFVLQGQQAQAQQPDPCNTSLGGDDSVYTGPVGTRTGYGSVALTQPTRIDRGREFIKVGKEAGRFATIKLENRAGSSFIQEVGIQFANGTNQVVHLNQNLSANNPCITIDLTGNERAINQIIVYGSTARHSSFQVMGA